MWKAYFDFFSLFLFPDVRLCSAAELAGIAVVIALMGHCKGLFYLGGVRRFWFSLLSRYTFAEKDK